MICKKKKKKRWQRCCEKCRKFKILLGPVGGGAAINR